jgi:iron complex transport system substrate-binding protein
MMQDIWFYDYGINEATKLANDWIEDPLFKNLNVSKSGNVSQVDDIIWNTAGGVLAANLMLDDIEEYFLNK